MSTTANVTNFTTTPNTQFQIGGEPWSVQGAGRSYSLTNPDAQTLQFEIQPGDYAWFDGSSIDRSEISGSYIPAGTPVAVDYQFMVQPNGPNNKFTNTAWFFTTAEMHDGGPVAGTSPPYEIVLQGDHLALIARYVQPGGNPSNGSSDLHMMTLWTDPNPIVPGQYYDINVHSSVSNTGGGYLQLSVNGQQVVNYSGPLGYGNQTYWAEGLYRNAGPTETVAANFRNLTLVTGSQAAGWTGVGGTTSSGSTTQPTTPTSPTTPVNVAPTVTQASASPGTGIEYPGDTITFTLGFSEAVNVTGTPTLSLNDGAKATYVGGSGTNSLTFQTTVASTDTTTSALAITGVSLPSGASINDASGLAADLSGAVKTFTGLQIDPPTIPTTPSVTRPVLTVADDSLWVAGRGGTVDLGVNVTTTDPNDLVTVNITGLPRYETITDKLDGQTFRGNNITLTAAQVDSGLELHSYYRGGAHPVATLTLTANAKDPVTGTVASAAPQTITVTDPRPTATTTTTSPQTTTVTNPPSSTSASSGFPGGLGSARQPHADSVTSTAPQPITVMDRLATAAGAGFLANQGFAMLQQRMETVTSTLATTRSQAMVTDPQLATGTTTASLASQSFALLNQYLAGNLGRADSGQIVAAVSQVTGFGQAALLARPH